MKSLIESIEQFKNSFKQWDSAQNGSESVILYHFDGDLVASLEGLTSLALQAKPVLIEHQSSISVEEVCTNSTGVETETVTTQGDDNSLQKKEYHEKEQEADVATQSAQNQGTEIIELNNQYDTLFAKMGELKTENDELLQTKESIRHKYVDLLDTTEDLKQRLNKAITDGEAQCITINRLTGLLETSTNLKFQDLQNEMDSLRERLSKATNLSKNYHRMPSSQVYQEALNLYIPMEAENQILKNKNAKLETELQQERIKNTQLISQNVPKEEHVGGGHGYHATTYKTLLSLDFHRVASEIAKWRDKTIVSEVVNQIKHELSKRILRDGMRLVEGNQETTSIQDSVVEQCHLYLDAFLSKNTAIKGFEIDKLKDEMSKLVVKSIDLVAKIHHAPPKGRLLWVEPMQSFPFDAELHEPLRNYDGSAEIEKTIFPGYYTYDNCTVFEKAIVTTTKKKA